MVTSFLYFVMEQDVQSMDELKISCCVLSYQSTRFRVSRSLLNCNGSKPTFQKETLSLNGLLQLLQCLVISLQQSRPFNKMCLFSQQRIAFMLADTQKYC